MTYTKQTWANGAAGLTPISAARLAHMEDGIEAAANGVTTLAGFSAALTAAIAAGGGDIVVTDIIPLGTTTFTIPNGVNVKCVGEGAFTYNGAGVAFTFNAQSRANSIISITRISLTWDAAENPDATSIGVRLLNCEDGTYVIARCENFETGIELRGSAGAVDAGTHSCTIYLGRVANNKRNLRFSVDTTGVGIGYANQNTFIGGRIRHDSGRISYSGTIGIDLSTAGNGNLFLGVNLEGGAVEKVVKISSVENVFLNCRQEGLLANSFEFMAASSGNYVIGGYGNFGPTSSHFSDLSTTGANIIIGARGASMVTAGANGGWVVRALTSNGDSAYRSRRTKASGGTIGWEALCDGTQQGFATGEAHPRFKDITTGGPGGYGAHTQGRGNIAPDVQFGRTSGNSPGWTTNCPIIRKAISVTWAGGGLTQVVSSGEMFLITMTGVVGGFALSGAVDVGHTITLFFIQDAVGGRSPTWPSNIKLAGGVVPANADANKNTNITIVWDGTNWQEISRAVNVG